MLELGHGAWAAHALAPCFWLSCHLLFPAVLAAFAYWAEHNINSEDDDEDEEDEGEEECERIQAICSRIRFPDIPASILLSYYSHFKFMRWFDPDKELLLRAVSELQLHALACTCLHPSLLASAGAAAVS